MTQVQSVIRRLSNVDDKEKTKEHDIGRETTEDFLGLRISGGQLVQTKKNLENVDVAFRGILLIQMR